jgi:hypothetical protein
MRRIVRDMTTLPMLAEAIAAFNGEHADSLRACRSYPDVTADDAAVVERGWATTAAAFTVCADAHSIPAWTVHARKALNPGIGDHAWTRVLVGRIRFVDVDFTARRFHAVTRPPARSALRVPWPLVWWRTGLFHPVAGHFGRVELSPAAPRSSSGNT